MQHLLCRLLGVVIVCVSSASAQNPLTPQNPFPKEQVYFEFQVELPVKPRPDSPSPAYPPVLLMSKTEGYVLAQFVVDTLGIADTTTFKVLKSDHELFSSAVRRSLSQLRFTPAKLSGRPVNQLVQMPFTFKPPQH
jgi:periplasmic protein TonB